MIRALFAGVTGLRNHQVAMDVIGNNIANVNTIGYKSSRITFEEGFVQMLEKAARPQNGIGGRNPIQIGTGSAVASIDQLYGQGSIESTGNPLDLAIQGDGLFVLRQGERQVYTRAGNFRLDAEGRLVSPFSGFVLQGINADNRGSFNASSPIDDLVIQMGIKAPAQHTSEISLTGNLDSSTEIGESHAMGVTVYDSLGAKHQLQLLFTNTGPGAWSWTASCETAEVTPAGTGTITFNQDGTLASFAYPGGGTGLTLTPANAEAFTISINSGTTGEVDGLSGFATASNGVVSKQNGFEAGDLVNVSVDANGTVNGSFSNGVIRPLAQIAMATFVNPSGLTRTGDNFYEESPNSGIAVMTSKMGGTNSITPGALEGSNVDITQEFSNMIVAQRGFQANARVITTADEMLNEIVNMKR
jgi:flagellar hook protein FlgE